MALTLTTENLLAARAGVRKLATRMQEQPPRDATDVEAAIWDLAPAPEWPYWLLALTAAETRAVGVIEAWLDSNQLDDEEREYLTANLELALEQGAGREPNEEEFHELVAKAFGQPIDIEDLVAPACLALNTLLCTPDPTTWEVILGKDS